MVNDYIRGVVEALSWVRSILRKNPDDPEATQKALSEVTTMLKLIANNIAADFPQKFELAAAAQ